MKYKNDNKNSNIKTKEVAFVMLSVVMTLAFGVFNTVLYAIHSSLWNLCIALYYYFVFSIKIALLAHEGVLLKGGFDNAQKKRLIANTWFRATFFVVDIALIAPIALMAMRERAVNYSEITAIGFAAYTVYKITASVVNLKKARESDNTSAQTLRALNFKDAILSIIALQYVLLETFGGTSELSIMSQITNFVLWLVILMVSVYELVDIAKTRKEIAKAISNDNK